MRYGSMFSGIEAASVAWKPLGWQCQFVCEIEPFPSAVLAHHYPDVPNLGDVTKVDWDEIRTIRPVDLLVFGSPCQSFSVAGKRLGLDDPRGNLALYALAVVNKLRPRWFVFENVPGLLSSGEGRDFGQFLATVGECGYQCAWRILDAQYFGVAQRRRRVFVVGHLGDWRAAAAVLFERESLLGHPAPRRETRKGVAPTLSARAKGGGGLGTDFDCDGGLIPSVSPTLRAGGNRTGGDRPPGTDVDTVESLIVAHAFDARQSDVTQYGDITGPLDTNGASIAVAFAENSRAEIRLEGGDGSRVGALSTGGGKPGQGAPMIAMSVNLRGRDGGATAELSGEVATALRASQGGGDKQHALTGSAVRRLTPRECERLQGFPEITKRLKITVWRSLDHQKNFAHAAIQSRRSPLSASNADANALPLSANAAGQSSPIGQQNQNEHAAVYVLIDLERQVLRLHSRGKLLWSASTAESQSSYLLRMPSDAFARLVVHTLTTAERTIPAGKAASQPSTKHFLHQENGSVSAHLYGREIEELASDAEMFTQSLSRCTKSTTSGVGQDSPSSEPILETLCCCVAAAISSSIPDSIRTASSFDVVVETVTGYTNINVRGKPAADGPRYKALGNSMAVNVMRWIGDRIQMVENLTIKDAA